MTPSPKRICLGVVTGAHGLRGWVKVKSYTDDPTALIDYGDLTNASGTRAYRLVLRGEAKGQLIAEISGIGDRNAAEAMRGTEFYAERDAIPAPESGDEFLIDDLIGMKVVLQDGGEYGVVKAVYNFGAGDIIEIAPAEGKPELYAFTLATFPEIDEGTRRLTFSPPEILPARSEEKDE